MYSGLWCFRCRLLARIDAVERRAVGDTEIAIDDAGQVICRGPGVMCGYYRDQGATERRILDGWLQTGDLGQLDDQGRLKILGRMDAMICLSTGRKVYPAEIESRITRAEGIEHAIVMKHGDSGLKAIVASDWAIDAAELEETVKHELRELPAYMIPLRIERFPFSLSVADGTLTAKGTVVRNRIAERLAQVEDTAASE